ncbi:hypothetical protein [Streptosporangium canum]|uniref:hypothetical protein n=1 Tax=Streptosporangium canum TaxID=324952 RepID=UPI0037A9AE07
MTTNRMTPEQTAARTALANEYIHVSFGQGRHGGWGFGMAVRTYRGDYASVGQFGWDGGAGTSTYADPDKQLTGFPLTRVGMSTPDSARLIHDFWTTLYQAIDDWHRAHVTVRPLESTAPDGQHLARTVDGATRGWAWSCLPNAGAVRG